jgi:zinc/manganese transport system permease protein
VLSFLLEPFEFEFMRRGLLSALLLGLSGGALGAVLMLRRLALMGDALAHSLLPGIALAFLLVGPGPIALFVGALLAGLLTAGGSALVTRLTRLKEDAAFAALFITFFALGVALVSHLGSRLDLLHFLFGNILGVSPADLRLAAFATSLTLLAFLFFHRVILLETFDPVFHRATGGRGGLVHFAILALTVLNLVAALQTMGIVLALGLFLLPAVTAYLWCDRFLPLLALSSTLAVLGSATGLLASYHLGLASGASIVLCLGLAFLLSAFLSPRHGMLSRLRQRLAARNRVRPTRD